MVNRSEPITTAPITIEYYPQWSRWTRQTVTVALIIAAVYALTLLAPVMKLLSMTFLLSLIMFAPSHLITRQLHISHSIAVTLCYGFVIVLLIGAIAFFIPTSVDAANSLQRDAAQYYSQLQKTLRQVTPDQSFVMVLGIKVDLNPLITQVRSVVLGRDLSTSAGATLIPATDLRQLINTVTESLASAVSGITDLVSTSLTALFISFLLLLDLPNLEGALFGWIPSAYHREYRLLIDKMWSVWKGFLRGQVLVAFIVATLTWIQLTVMGVHNAIIVAVFAGIISTIPTVGSIVALVPIAASALIQGSSVFTNLPNGTFAILVVIVNLVISQTIWNLVAPKIMGNAVKLPLAIIFVGLFIGAAFGGILGAFLITPLIGTVRVITAYLLRKTGGQDPFPGEEPKGDLNAIENSSSSQYQWSVLSRFWIFRQ